MHYPRTRVRLIAPAALITFSGAPIAFGASLSPPLPFSATFDTTSLHGANGFVIQGAHSGDDSGWSVSRAGDVNGDGVDDIIIGARRADPNGLAEAGAAYVVFGRHTAANGGFPPSIDLASLDGATGFVVQGIDIGDRCGHSVSSAGDVNDDGIADLIISAHLGDPAGRLQAGEVYVVFGRNTATAGAFPATIDPQTLDGTNGFVVHGIDAGDELGESVSFAGDVNGDGIDDIILGAEGADPPGLGNAGEVYVIFGRADIGAGGTLNLTTLNGTTGFFARGNSAGTRTGSSVSAAGDFNNDGIGDLIIGARGANPYNEFQSQYAGESYLVIGKSTLGAGGSVVLNAFTGWNGLVVKGAGKEAGSGSSVSCAGDLNGDGFDELIIGAPGGLGFRGQTYIVFGRPAGSVGGILNVVDLDGTYGFLVNGVDHFGRSGWSVSGAGDINDDGFSDLVIGAPRHSVQGGTPIAGRAFIVFGGPHVGEAGSLLVTALNGANGFAVQGNVYDYCGFSVASADDVNGDGIGDIIIGAPGANPSGRADAGETYIIFGRRHRPSSRCPADVNGDAYADADDFTILASNFGSAVPVGTLGDLNSDGRVDAQDFVIYAAGFGCGAPE